MRTWNALGAAIGLSAALAVAGAAGAAEKPRQPVRPAPAPSAERHGVPTTDRAPALGQGYSARARHMADCLATYRTYDPDTDRVVVRPGVTRRCGL
jgi:hypothetical protein